MSYFLPLWNEVGVQYSSGVGEATGKEKKIVLRQSEVAILGQ